MNKRKSPYYRSVIAHPSQSELVICTGSNAWDRAKSMTWMSRSPKTVLILGDDPAKYRWPARGRVVMVFDFGPREEGYQRLLLLARQLLIDGAEWVLLMSRSFPMTRIDRKIAL
jgi:hypothetical protein